MSPEERWDLIEAWIEWGVAYAVLAMKLGMSKEDPDTFRRIYGPLGVLQEDVAHDRQGLPEDPFEWNKTFGHYEAKFAAIDMQPVIDYVKAHTPSP